MQKRHTNRERYFEEQAQTTRNYYIPYIKGYFTASGVFRTDDIKTGNIIGYVGSSSSATYFPKTVTNSNDEHIQLNGNLTMSSI